VTIDELVRLKKNSAIKQYHDFVTNILENGNEYIRKSSRSLQTASKRTLHQGKKTKVLQSSLCTSPYRITMEKSLCIRYNLPLTLWKAPFIVVHNRDRPKIFQNSLIECTLPGFRLIYKTLQTFPKWFKDWSRSIISKWNCERCFMKF